MYVITHSWSNNGSVNTSSLNEMGRSYCLNETSCKLLHWILTSVYSFFFNLKN